MVSSSSYFIVRVFGQIITNSNDNTYKWDNCNATSTMSEPLQAKPAQRQTRWQEQPRPGTSLMTDRDKLAAKTVPGLISLSNITRLDYGQKLTMEFVWCQHSDILSNAEQAQLDQEIGNMTWTEFAEADCDWKVKIPSDSLSRGCGVSYSPQPLR
jgi:hypothetical protein